MKKNVFIVFLILISYQAFSQENMVTLSGGYSFANVDNDFKGTGYRINGLFEFKPMSGKFAHGISFGYIHLTSIDEKVSGTATRTVNSFPVYYAPKVMFGSEKFKFFIKGALGMQFAGLKREGAGVVALDDNDFGFYGGGGAGVMLFLSEKLFINAEYEIAWASNSWYNDGWINSAMGGIGFRF